MEKLVRDGIPALIRASGKVASYRLSTPDERLPLLLSKLKEEALELEDAPSLEELSDVYEVLEAIKAELNYSDLQIAAERLRKNSERGTFKDGIILDLDPNG